MTKKSFDPPPSRDVSWLTEPGKDGKRDKVVIVAKEELKAFAANRDNHIIPEKPILPVNVENVEIVEKQAEEAIVTHFNIPANPAFVARLYSEVYHDPDRRPLYLVLQEIFEAGLKDRPYKGPASDTFIAQLKKRGQRKKS